MKKLLVCLFTILSIGAFSLHSQDAYNQYKERLSTLKKRLEKSEHKIPLNQTPSLNETIDLLQTATMELIKLHEVGELRKDLSIIDKGVMNKREVALSFFEPRTEKKKTYKDHTEKTLGKENTPLGQTYGLPSWPFNASFYREKDMVQFFLSYNWATKSFSKSGSDQDVSTIEFANPCIRLKDILLLSKLANAGQITYNNTKDNYLTALADQLIVFNGRTDQVKGHIAYSRHFLDNKLAFGVLFPFVYKKHKLTFTTPDIASKLNATQTTNLNNTYSDGFVGLFADILKKKGISYASRNSESGLSDMEIFIHYNIPKIAKKFLIGLKTIWPTAQKCDCSTLWEPKLGNSGFTQIAPFISLMFSGNTFINVHSYLSATYSFPAHVNKRIPHLIQKTTPTTRDVGIFSDKVKSISGSICHYDANIRSFADESHCLRITPGFAAEFMIGNQIQNFVFKRGSFDIFYHVRGKGSDSIGGTLPEAIYNKPLLKHQTYWIDQRVGAEFDYQISDDNRFNVGTLYTIAGRNTPKTFEVYTAFNFEF